MRHLFIICFFYLLLTSEQFIFTALLLDTIYEEPEEKNIKILEPKTDSGLLLLFTEKQYLFAIKWTLDRGYSPKNKDRFGNTVLHLVSNNLYYRQILSPEENNIANIIRLLLSAGAEIEEENLAGETPLYVATKKDDIKVISKLLEAKADPNSLNTKKFETPLHAAVRNASVLAVKKLLEKNARPDIKSDEKTSPLDYALDSKLYNLCCDNASQSQKEKSEKYNVIVELLGENL